MGEGNTKEGHDQVTASSMASEITGINHCLSTSMASYKLKCPCMSAKKRAEHAMATLAVAVTVL